MISLKDLETYSPIGLFITLGAWVFKQFYALSDEQKGHYKETTDRLLVLETLDSVSNKKIENMATRQEEHHHLITQFQGDLAVLKEGQLRADRRHEEIRNGIAEMTRSIDTFTAAVQTILPKAVIEERWASQERRLRALEEE